MADERNAPIYEKYPDLKEDLIIKLWSRTGYFFGNLAEKYHAQANQIRLEERFPHDYCWQASAILQFGIENATYRVYAGFGLEAHQALLNLFHAVKNDIPYDMDWWEHGTKLVMWKPEGDGSMKVEGEKCLCECPVGKPCEHTPKE